MPKVTANVSKQVESHPLGQAAAWPIRGLIEHFRPEREHRIADHAIQEAAE